MVVCCGVIAEVGAVGVGTWGVTAWGLQLRSKTLESLPTELESVSMGFVQIDLVLSGLWATGGGGGRGSSSSSSSGTLTSELVSGVDGDPEDASDILCGEGVAGQLDMLPPLW